ncbi:MAG: RDD family protein [Thermoleophilaceae bacterium]|jgi:uncharacterized RDD family membrane protein YckC
MALLAAGGAQTAARRVHGAPVAEAPPAIVYAGFVTRTIAFALDALLLDVVAVAVAAVVALVFSVFPVSSGVHDAAIAAGGVLFVIWTLAYFTTFWTTTGQTPGSRVMTIRVIRADGGKLRPRHALVRLVGLVLSLPLLLGYLPILVTDRRRGLFDAMAGTVVVGAQSPV